MATNPYFFLLLPYFLFLPYCSFLHPFAFSLPNSIVSSYPEIHLSKFPSPSAFLPLVRNTSFFIWRKETQLTPSKDIVSTSYIMILEVDFFTFDHLLFLTRIHSIFHFTRISLCLITINSFGMRKCSSTTSSVQSAFIYLIISPSLPSKELNCSKDKTFSSI